MDILLPVWKQGGRFGQGSHSKRVIDTIDFMPFAFAQVPLDVFKILLNITVPMRLCSVQEMNALKKN